MIKQFKKDQKVIRVSDTSIGKIVGINIDISGGVSSLDVQFPAGIVKEVPSDDLEIVETKYPY
ncbi:MAG: hypothetical protein HYV97_15265 [Bdellovibrio sp.]|nr:hypothetical protein [Bdellovibrio sp.]